MRISKKVLAFTLSILMAVSMMPFTASATEGGGEGGSGFQPGPSLGDGVAVINDGFIEYDTLDEAISEAANGDKITLVADVVVTTPVVIPAGKSVKLDLNGHSLSGNIADADGKKLIQVSGELEFTGTNGGCVYNTNTAGQGHAACQALTGGTITVNAPVTFGDSDTDRTNANSTNRGCGIQNNGGTLIINDGYYTAIDANYTTGAWAYAILNCAGDTTINNATVYGNGLHGAVGCEAGTLTVNDGTFAVDGATNYYSLYIDGGVATVNGGTFTNNGKYGVNYLGTGATTNITGGSFTYSVPFVVSSSKGNPVVTGGTFGGDVTAYLAEGYLQNATTGTVSKAVAKVGTTYYADFEEAVAAARTGSAKTVKLINDVDLTTQYPAFGTAGCMHYIDITGVTVDLDGHDISIGSRFSVLFTGENGKIMNGTCTGHDCAKWPEYEYGIYVWGSGSGDIRDSDGSTTSITLENLTVNNGIHCWNSTVTIINCNSTGSDSYYGVWADELTNVTIESGNYSTNGAAVLGAAKSTDGDGNISVTGGDYTVPSGKKLVLPASSSSNPENVKFSAGTTNVPILAANCAEGYEPTTEPDLNGKYTVKTTESIPEHGFSLELQDEIDMNLYLNIDGNDNIGNSENAKVVIEYQRPDTQDNTTVESVYSAAELNNAEVPGDGRSKITILAAPSQIKEDITVKIIEGETIKETFTTSVADYCNAIIKSSSNEELVDLAKAMLDYGKAVSESLNYNNDKFVADEFINKDDVTSELLSEAYALKTNEGYMSSFSYIATAVPALRIYTTQPEFDAAIRGCRATAYDETASYLIGNAIEPFVVEKTPGNEVVCFDITGILPENLDHVIRINYDGQEIRVNPLAYAVQAGGDLGRSIYNYYKAAKAYFPTV